MNRLTQRFAPVLIGAGLALGASLGALGTVPAVAAAGPATCTADLTIFTSSPGTSRPAGPVTVVRDSGVGGQYTSGFLTGYTIAGAQDLIVNSQTNRSQLHGSFVATSPDKGSTLTIRYVGQADLTTGAATGTFSSTRGTGTLSGFHWTGDITAQLVSANPPTFKATDSGVCFPAP